MHVEQFQQNFEGHHQHSPHLPLVGQPRTRSRAPCSFFIALRRHDATNLICTAVAVDLSPNSTCTPSRENVRHSRVKQSSGCTLPSAYAHSSDALHNIKYDTASPNHMTHPPSSILTSACRPCDNSHDDSGNLTCAFFSDMPCARSIPFSTAAVMQCDIGNSHPATLYERS